MNTKAIAALIVFLALTVVLNPAFTGIAIPFPLFPYVFFYLWEIPIVAALFLFGPKYGVAIALLNIPLLLAISPGFAPQQPFYQSAAAITMLLGIFVATKFAAPRGVQAEANPRRRKFLASSMALGLLFRVGIMAIVAYTLFRFPVVGFNLTEPVILAVVPLIMIYDAFFSLYTIPLGYLIAEVVQKNLKTESSNLPVSTS